MSEDAAGALGVILLLGMVATAVAVFIRWGMKLQAYEYLTEEEIRITEDVEVLVRKERKAAQKQYSRNNIIGVVLCILAAVPLIAVAMLPSNMDEFLTYFGMSLILMLVAIGVLVPKVDNPSYWPVFILNAAIMLICLTILVKTTNEPKLVKVMEEESKAFEDEPEEAAVMETKGDKLAPEVKKSLYLILASVFLWFMGYNAITTSFSKYANVYWGLQGGAYAYTLIIAQAACGHTHADGTSCSSDGSDPHVWLSCDNACTIAQNIASALSEALPEHKEQYAKNLSAFKAKFEALRQETSDKLAPYAGKTFFVYHPATLFY